MTGLVRLNRAIMPEWLLNIPQLPYYVKPIFHPEFLQFIRYLFTRQMSTFITVFGRRELGKTNLALVLAEVLFWYLGFKHIATNISIQDDNGMGIREITNLDDLKLWAKSNPGRKAFLFDEIGRTIRRRSPMSSLNVKLISELQILRKFKLSIVACTIDEKYVDNAVLGSDILDGSFVKPYVYDNPRTNQKIALYRDLLRNVHKTIENIPATLVKFDTWGTALFTEHGPIGKAAFKDDDLNKLSAWANGKRISELGLSRTQFHRINKKFIKRMLERERTA